ncbi:MAG: beta-ketoacyl-ACP synthase II, partial [Bacteroidota bacterium]
PRRVVVTGLGAISPCGHDVPSNFESVIEGRSGIGPLTRFDATGYATRIAGEVRDFDAGAAVGKKLARRTGRFMQMGIVAADEAMRDAGFDLEGALDGSPGLWPESERFGVFVGSGIGGFPEIVEAAVDLNERGPRAVSPFFIPTALANLATGQIAIRYGARGPSLVVVTACAVGNHSIGEGFRSIRDGDADVVVAGGAEAAIGPLGITGFMNMKALSSRNDDPSTASRPFDKDRDGFVMSEGSGVVVLEDYEHAKARDARIYCELVGYAMTTDAHHITAPSPGGEGAVRCMRAALRSAGMNPEDVGYINAHGTSTPANDSTETQAIRTAFGAHADKLAVSSTKGATGHLLGAAGGIEAVLVSLALHRGVIPPTANHHTADPECDLDIVPNTAREQRIGVAMSNGFGFGGTNAVLVFKEA